MRSRFGCIYNYDFELFRQRMLGEEGVTQLLFKFAWMVCVCVWSQFGFSSSQSPARPLMNFGKLWSQLIFFSSILSCHLQQLVSTYDLWHSTSNRLEIKSNLHLNLNLGNGFTEMYSIDPSLWWRRCSQTPQLPSGVICIITCSWL